MPAVLIETGFINTDADNALFDERFDDIAAAIARAIEETVGDGFDKLQNDSDKWKNDNADSEYDNQLEQGNKDFGVQVGLYTRYENALYQAMELEKKGYTVRIVNRRPFYAVVVDTEEGLDGAGQIERKLEREGYDTLIINL